MELQQPEGFPDANGTSRGAAPEPAPRDPAPQLGNQPRLQNPPPPPAETTAETTVEMTAERELGVSLHRLRLENGLSLRALAQRIGYSAHSVVADIEKCRRIPSEALIRSYEDCFGVTDGSLHALRRRAMAERAARLTGGTRRPAGKDPHPAGRRSYPENGGPHAAGECPQAEDGPDRPARDSVPDILRRLVTVLLAQATPTIGRRRR